MCTMFIIEKMIAHSIPNKHHESGMSIDNETNTLQTRFKHRRCVMLIDKNKIARPTPFSTVGAIN